MVMWLLLQGFLMFLVCIRSTQLNLISKMAIATSLTIASGTKYEHDTFGILLILQ